MGQEMLVLHVRKIVYTRKKACVKSMGNDFCRANGSAQCSALNFDDSAPTEDTRQVANSGFVRVLSSFFIR